MAADLADPGEQGSLPAIGIEPAHHLAQRGLHHFLGHVHIAVEPRQREAVQTGEILVEELVESPLVAGQHAAEK